MAAGSAAAVAASALLALRPAGDDGFPTDPVGVLALAAASTGTAVAAARLTAAGGGRRAAGGGRAGRLASWLCLALLAYLVLAAWAVQAVAADHPTAAVAVALWSSAWIPPLALMQLTASAAIRCRGGRHGRTGASSWRSPRSRSRTPC
ncbi:hypothetical protein ACWCOT_36145 [Nonomuraea bangladeshensis]